MFSTINKLRFTKQISFILFCGILLWLPSFISPPQIQLQNPLSPLYNKVFYFLQLWQYLPVIMGLLNIYLLVFLFNNTLSKNEIILKNNLLPAFFLIILSAWHNDLLTFFSIIPASIFLTLFIRQLFAIANQINTLNNAFLLGFFLALASMFYFPAIAFIALIPIGFIVLRMFSLRHWLLSFIGLSFPYICFFIWKYINDNLTQSIYEYVLFFKNFELSSPYIPFNNFNLWIILCFAFLLFISFLKMILRLSEKNISIRRNLIIIIWFTLICLFGFFVQNQNIIHYSLFITMPTALHLYNYIANIKNKLLQDFLFFLILLFIIYFKIF